MGYQGGSFSHTKLTTLPQPSALDHQASSLIGATVQSQPQDIKPENMVFVSKARSKQLQRKLLVSRARHGQAQNLKLPFAEIWRIARLSPALDIMVFLESLLTTPGVGSSRTQTAITSRQGRVLTMLCRCHWGLEVHPSNGSKFSTQWPLGELDDLQHWCEKPVICENEWSIFGYSWVF